MAIQDILNKIKNDAISQAEKLKEENEKETDSINAKADKTIKAIEDEAVSLSKKRYDEEKRLKISLATLELKNKLLAAKQSLIKEAFEKALLEIKAMPAEKYRQLLIKAVLEVDARGDEEIILGSHDYDKLGAAIVDEINSAFSKNGKKGGFKLLDVKRDDITGCVIKDGRKETICTFEAIIAAKRKELEKEVVSILFSE